MENSVQFSRVAEEECCVYDGILVHNLNTHTARQTERKEKGHAAVFSFRFLIHPLYIIISSSSQVIFHTNILLLLIGVFFKCFFYL